MAGGVVLALLALYVALHGGGWPEYGAFGWGIVWLVRGVALLAWMKAQPDES
jgi:hypothetical protein